MDNTEKQAPLVDADAPIEPQTAESDKAAAPSSQPSAEDLDPAPRPVADGSTSVVAEPEAKAEVEQVDPLDHAKQESERYRNQMLRIAADFDNFRKRSRREVEDASRRSREDFLREVLPVFDNLERAALHAEQVVEARAVADGVKMVLRQFQDTLTKVGIARLKAVGTAFDPNFHEAIQQISTDEQPPGTVVAEVVPGYTWDERLVRAAMVVVAKAPPPPEPTPEPQPEPVPEPSPAAGSEP